MEDVLSPSFRSCNPVMPPDSSKGTGTRTVRSDCDPITTSRAVSRCDRLVDGSTVSALSVGVLDLGKGEVKLFSGAR